MPIRTKSLEQAAREFVKSYQGHLTLGSAPSLLDPRQCEACRSAFDDLIFALDGTSSPRGSFYKISGDLELQQEDKIVSLYGN